MKKFILLFFCLTFCLQGAVLTERSQARAEIILGEKPTRAAQFAAFELQHHIRLMTGATLPIVKKAASAPTKIFIGKPGDFQSQEYQIEVKDNRIELSGKDEPDFGIVNYARYQTYPGYWKEKGSLYAVYDFLELLGIRWYLPTTLGTAYEKTPDLSIKEVHIRRKPSFIFRDMMALPIPGDLCGDTIGNRAEALRKQLPQKERVLWFLRQRHGGKQMELGHTLYTYYKRFYPARKEWFAKGQTAAPDMQLCYTNPELIAQVVKDARDFFDGKIENARTILYNFPPKYRSDCYPLGAMDNRRWCRCDKCQALLRMDGQNPYDHFSSGNASEYWFTFVAAVAKELKKSHPDKWVGTLCYSGYTLPPKHVSLPDNVIVRPAVNVTRSHSKEAMDGIAKLLQRWKESVPDAVKFISIWYCYPNVLAQQEKTRLFPHFLGRHVKEYFRYFKEMGASGMFWEPSYVVGGAGPMFDMVDGYINWKLAWNLDLDAGQLYDELFSRFYGPAAGDMKTFYDLAEKIYSDPANYPNREMDQNEGLAWHFIGTEKNMERLQSALDRAVKSATEEPYKSRVALFRNTLWEYMLKGKKAADAHRQESLTVTPDNLIEDGAFEEIPVGQNSKLTAFGIIVPGGISGNAMELKCSIAQNKLFRTPNLNLKINKLTAGRWRFTGYLKGDFNTFWCSFSFTSSKGKERRIFNLRKSCLITDENHWRSFRCNFSVPQGVEGGEMLFQIYGSKNAPILLDNFKLVRTGNP